jgi:ParB family chromosome partitioning protein
MSFRSILPLGGRRVVEIPLDEVRPNPAQPRRVFEEASLHSLAASIEENGLICPISVRRLENGFELIAGERRTMAFRLLGRDKIPAIVEDADDERSATLALIENLQRSDLDFLEEALALRSLLELGGHTQKELAMRLGLSQPSLANKLRVLHLPRVSLERLAQAGCTERHARALLPLAEDDRLPLAVERVVTHSMTVAKTEKMVARLLETQERRGGRLLILKDLRLFTSTINRAVDVMKEAGIDASSTKTEDADRITYTIVIPKSASRRPHLAAQEPISV